jgi:hypothetical protein
MRNNLREVTLNNRVKLNLALICSRAFEYACIMLSDDENYALDTDGNRVLIGLTHGETREFEILDEFVSTLSPTSPVSDDGRSVIERRWLVLYEKHEAALRRYEPNQK